MEYKTNMITNKDELREALAQQEKLPKNNQLDYQLNANAETSQNVMNDNQATTQNMDSPLIWSKQNI